MRYADPHMLKDHWLVEGRMHGSGAFGAETVENYGRDLGNLTSDGQPIDLLRLADWKQRRDAAARAGEPFDETPPPLGWISFIGDLIWEATPFHVDAWLNQWRHGAERSRARRRAALFSFYEHARAQSIVPGNPVRPIRPGDLSELPKRVKLSRRQSGQMRSAADRYADPRDRLLIYLLLAGLRPFQACGLFVERTYRAQDGTWTSRLPVKGGGFDPKPWVWPAECAEVLREYLGGARWVRPPHSYEDRGPLLTSFNGRALTADTEPRRIVRKIAELHPGLAELAPRLSADGVALSLSPFEDDEESER
ncbi:hypothetical protein [Streptomyces albogriseolus]|uniref:hypothetical protein n=1 Tax=Streptomyces albogriseolus TaxID=1887 RepID=UPI0034602A65